MQLYALQIRKSDLPLLALLNGGMEPKVEKNKTYLVFDSTWNSDVPNEIVTERQLAERYDIKVNGPLLLALKK